MSLIVILHTNGLKINKFMKLSIITVCFNDKAGFERTAKSVVAQKFRDFEWIVIDGGSTDGSAEVIKEYSRYMSYWVSEADKGIYNAMNKGISQAKGEYLIFMNSGDCLYDSNVLENVSSFLFKKDIYIGSMVVDCIDSQKTFNVPETIDNHWLLNKMAFSGIPHQASFIKKEVFEKYGYYREDLRIVSDWYHFYQIVMMSNATVSSLPYIIALYDGNGISSNSNKMLSERIRSLDMIPNQQTLFCFYRDNYEIMHAFKSNIWGRTIMRFYFFIYRHLKK